MNHSASLHHRPWDTLVPESLHTYKVAKKSCPFLNSQNTTKVGQDFPGIQYEAELQKEKSYENAQITFLFYGRLNSSRQEKIYLA